MADSQFFQFSEHIDVAAYRSNERAFDCALLVIGKWYCFDAGARLIGPCDSMTAIYEFAHENDITLSREAFVAKAGAPESRCILLDGVSAAAAAAPSPFTYYGAPPTPPGPRSPGGASCGSIAYWSELCAAYTADRPLLLAVVPDGHWIAYTFGWLRDGHRTTYATKPAQPLGGDLPFIVRPGHEIADAAARPAVVVPTPMAEDDDRVPASAKNEQIMRHLWQWFVGVWETSTTMKDRRWHLVDMDPATRRPFFVNGSERPKGFKTDSSLWMWVEETHKTPSIYAVSARVGEKRSPFFVLQFDADGRYTRVDEDATARPAAATPVDPEFQALMNHRQENIRVFHEQEALFPKGTWLAVDGGKVIATAPDQETMLESSDYLRWSRAIVSGCVGYPLSCEGHVVYDV